MVKLLPPVSSSGHNMVVDLDLDLFRIQCLCVDRIRIPNPDPGSGSRGKVYEDNEVENVFFIFLQL
jgi:hypothetical protein